MKHIKVDRLDTWTIYIVKTYNYFREGDNKVDNYDDIPIEAIKYLSAFTYLELITPFVCKDLQLGKKIGQIQTTYRITKVEARSLGIKLGYYTRRNTKNT